MAKRSFRRVSEGLEGRSKRPGDVARAAPSLAKPDLLKKHREPTSDRTLWHTVALPILSSLEEHDPVRFLPLVTFRRWLFGVVVLPVATAVGADSFYKDAGIFSTRPSETASLNTIDRFGPVGLGIELHQPAFVMKVKNVEEGSPAAATGRLAKGQVIESINGQKLAAIDPRIQLGTILAEAEATDGKLLFLVRDDAEGAKAEEVVVSIPVLGRYSPTWPLDCPKSEKIVRGFADYLAQPKSNPGFSNIGMLFLLSTGDDKDLAPVRAWVHSLADKPAATYAWHLGYAGIPLCEYYLRTGDPAALPVIEKWAKSAKEREYLDAWAGRGGVTAVGYGNGHLNAGATAVVTFLLLAKECGAKVDESLLHRTLTHFFRYAGRGNNPYGDDRPETSFVDNGKNGNLAFVMAAAASLTPEGEKSIYARARDVAAMSSFYTTTYMLHGHTGGGIGEIWRSAAMGLLHDKKPKQYRDFMDSRQWHYDLSRRCIGSFGILGGAGYDDEEWGAGYALTYTIPRKTLRITGASSPHAKPYALPERPWGTAADDAFESLEPAIGADGAKQDVSGETIARDSGRTLINRLTAKETVSDDEVRRLVHHPEYLIRFMAANHAAGRTIAYMTTAAGPQVRPELLAELRHSADPRVREAGFRGTIVAFDPSAPWAPDAFADAVARLADADESWWLKDAALALIARGTPDMIAPHVDRILPYLAHPEQWLQNRALTALAPVITDERCYAKVLPPVGKLLRTCERWSTTAGPMNAIREQLAKASPEVRNLASQTIESAFTGYAGVRTWPGGQNIATVYDSHLELLATTLADVPGGYDVLFEVAKRRYPDAPLPYASIFLAADREQLSPRLRELIKPIVRDQLVYEYMGQNRAGILAQAAATKQSDFTVGPIDALVALYQRADIHDYDWHVFGPNLKDATWDYFTFDPPEKQAYDISPWRYRPVTLPKGMEKWFEPSFNPSSAGWKKGQAPFGQYAGKLLDGTHVAPIPGFEKRGEKDRFGPLAGRACPMPGCEQHSVAMRTMWDKEVLLVRGTFDFPKLEPGHLYRVRVGTGQHVGSGDGYRISINGRQLIEAKEGVGRRAGNRPRGAFITADFLREFGNGPVTIAATAFLRYGDRAVVTMPPVPQGIFNLWIEEMQLPPLDAEAFRKAAAFMPMRSAEWQASLASRDTHPSSDEGDSASVAWFHYDGGCIANPGVLGAWKTVALVPTINGFDPTAKPGDTRRAPFQQIQFKDGGLTDHPEFAWSGDRLVSLARSEALRVNHGTVAEAEYLFIEVGGFSEKNPPGWTSPWVVLKRP